MSRCRQAVHDFISGHEGTEGQAAADGLAHDDAVRDDIVMLNGEELACAVEGLLDLLTDKEDAMLSAKLVELLHENRMGRENSGVALNRLNHDGGDFVGRQPGGKGGLNGRDTVSLTDIIRHVVPKVGESINLRQERPHLLVHLG